jgi:hypothetical protein
MVRLCVSTCFSKHSVNMQCVVKRAPDVERNSSSAGATKKFSFYHLGPKGKSRVVILALPLCLLSSGSAIAMSSTETKEKDKGFCILCKQWEGDVDKDRKLVSIFECAFTIRKT